MQRVFPLLKSLSAIVLVLSASCQSGMQEDSTFDDPAIHWWGIYGIYEIPHSEEREFRSRSEYNGLSPVAYSSRGPIYRVPVERDGWLKEHGYRPLRDVPFVYVDPDIETRRKSDDPAIWFSGYKDREIVEKILAYFEQARPDICRRYVIGKSVKDRPIYAMRISNRPDHDEDEPSLLFNGAHHGNELISIDYVLDMAALLLNLEGPRIHPDLRERFPGFRETEREAILSSFEVWIVPVVNPDGLEDYWNRSIHAGRKNAHGVDLNRNYPFYWNTGQTGASGSSVEFHDYRGPSAASEPETKAMMDFAHRERFSVVYSYHTFATRLLFPYTIDAVMNPWPDRAFFYATRWAKEGESFRATRKYNAARKLYPVDGTDQDWLFFEFGTLALIVEGSMASPLYSDALRSIAGMRPVWESPFRDLLNGPVLGLHVLDTAGMPVKNAEVRVLDEAKFENERWTVHPETGRFDLLPGPLKELHIEVRAAGFRTMRKKLTCRKNCKEKFYLTR